MELLRRGRDFCTFLVRKKYEEGKTDAEIEAIKSTRLQVYGMICQLGVANMFWNGTTDVMKELAVNYKDKIQFSVACFTCALLSMIVGGVAAAFPDSTPFPMFFAGFGAWQAILCLFGSYHMDMVLFFPRPQNSMNSMVITSALFTVYWALGAQDPWVVHLIGRLLLWIYKGICGIGEWFGSVISKAGGAFEKLATHSPKSFFLRRSSARCRDQAPPAKGQP